MDDLSELPKHRLWRYFVTRRVLDDVRLNCPRGNKHDFYVLVQEIAFQAKGVIHQVKRTLGRGVQPVPRGCPINDVIGKFLLEMKGPTYSRR